MQLMASEMGNTVLYVYILSCYLSQIASLHGIDRSILSTNQSCTMQHNSNEKTIGVIYEGCFHEHSSKHGLFSGTYYNLSTSSLSPATCLILCHEYTSFGLLYLDDTFQKCVCLSTNTKNGLTEVDPTLGCRTNIFIGDFIRFFKYVYVYKHEKEGFVKKLQELIQSNVNNYRDLTVFCETKDGKQTRANFTCEYDNRPHTGSNTRIECSHTSFDKTTIKYVTTQASVTSEQISHIPERTNTGDFITSEPTVGWCDTTFLSSPTLKPSELVTTAGKVTEHDDVDDFNISFILGCTLAGCLVVLLLPVLALLKRRNSANANRVKITSTTENGPSSECSDATRTPMPILQENYSDPCDKIYQVPGTDQNPGYSHVKPSIEEYHHLDFTLRSENKKVFHVDDGEYFRPRANTDSVFDQPWDNKTSKLNKMFMQFRSSVYDSVKNVRNSFLRKDGNNVIPENKKVYSDDWQPPFLGHHQSVANAACKPDDISIDIGTAQNNPELKEGPVLNQSNDSASNSKPNAKFDEIYREPRDRRISFRQRLSMMTSRPIKLSFGFDFGFGGDSNYHQNIQPKSVHEMPKSFEEAIDIDETSC